MLIGIVVFSFGFYLMLYTNTQGLFGADWFGADWLGPLENLGIVLMIVGIALALIGFLLLVKSLLTEKTWSGRCLRYPRLRAYSGFDI